MKIAIPDSSAGFTSGWIDACKRLGIEVVRFDVYSTSAMADILTCDAFMWHWHHASPSDYLFARQLIMATKMAGIRVFPDIATCWHFDDKVGQKYMFDAVNVPAVKSWVFYDKESAMKWAREAKYPLVFKLRCGAGAINVRLIHNLRQASAMIGKMFGSGFSASIFSDLMTTVRRKKKSGQLWQKLFRAPSIMMAKLAIRRCLPRQNGYVYFQNFIQGNAYDTRIVVIGERAIGIRRYCRPNDFRASGSGEISYEKSDIPEEAVRIAFESARKICAQCAAFDFVRDEGGEYQIVEVSYGFTVDAYSKCEGYWTSDMKWHKKPIEICEWMVRDLLNIVK